MLLIDQLLKALIPLIRLLASRLLAPSIARIDGADLVTLPYALVCLDEIAWIYDRLAILISSISVVSINQIEQPEQLKYS